jgi:uncharacterized lipoprotein YmbA
VNRTLSSCAVALVAGLLGGCGSSPISSFYTLKPDPALTSAGAVPSVYVVVSPVTIPELVDRPQIVVGGAGNEVRPNEFQRWAEPLKSDIQRTIASDLGLLLGTNYATVFDADSVGRPVWRVRVDVTRFESAPGDAATVEALWTIWPPKQAEPLIGHTLAREPVQGQGYDALVAAHDRALAAVSREIAAAIRARLGG